MRDQRPRLAGVGGDQGESDDGAASAAEDVGRLAAETDAGALRAELKLMFEQPG